MSEDWSAMAWEKIKRLEAENQALRAQSQALREALEAVKPAMSAVDEYLNYWSEAPGDDLRTSGEMALNRLQDSGELAEIRGKIAAALKLVRGE